MGSNGIVNIGANIPASGSPIWLATLASIKFGKINVDTTNDNNPAIKVEPYAIPVVIPNNFPAPVAKSAIPAVTKPIIINGITNFRNAENKVLTVTNICTIISGA